MNFKLLLCPALVLSSWLSCQSCPAAIIFPKLPDGCPPMTSRALADLRKAQPSLFTTVLFPTNLPVEKLRASKAFRCYFWNYQSILSGKLPDSEPADTSDRRMPENISREICHDYLSYMVLCGTNMLEMLTVGLDVKNHWQTFGAFYSLGQPDPTWMAYQKAKQLPQVKRQNYEFRLLMINAEIRAVWLHGKTDDIIIPYPLSYPTSWKGYQPYSVSEIGELLRRDFDQNTNNAGGVLNSNEIPRVHK